MCNLVSDVHKYCTEKYILEVNNWSWSLDLVYIDNGVSLTIPEQFLRVDQIVVTWLYVTDSLWLFMVTKAFVNHSNIPEPLERHPHTAYCKRNVSGELFYHVKLLKLQLSVVKNTTLTNIKLILIKWSCFYAPACTLKNSPCMINIEVKGSKVKVSHMLNQSLSWYNMVKIVNDKLVNLKAT